MGRSPLPTFSSHLQGGDGGGVWRRRQDHSAGLLEGRVVEVVVVEGEEGDGGGGGGDGEGGGGGGGGEGGGGGGGGRGGGGGGGDVWKAVWGNLASSAHV